MDFTLSLYGSSTRPENSFLTGILRHPQHPQNAHPQLSLSTFTATELLSYEDFVSLTVIANTMSLKRPDLKKKVSDMDEGVVVIE